MMCTCGGSRKRELTNDTRFRSGYRTLGQPKPSAYMSPKHMLTGLLSFGLAGRALQYRRYNPVDLFDMGATRQPHGL